MSKIPDYLRDIDSENGLGRGQPSDGRGMI